MNREVLRIVHREREAGNPRFADARVDVGAVAAGQDRVGGDALQQRRDGPNLLSGARRRR